MKKLPRQPMRPEQEPGEDKPLWKPTWHCFCCHDNGIVQSHLAALVIEDFNPNKDKLPLCQNPSCYAGNSYLMGSLKHCLDMRLDSTLCQTLDLEEREVWRQTLASQHNYLKQLREEERRLAQKMSLRKRDRTPEEERIIQARHEENRQLSPQEQDEYKKLGVSE